MQKQDQRSGKLTEGIVEEILTRGASHPHGLKVRLETGVVGRVKSVHDVPVQVQEEKKKKKLKKKKKKKNEILKWWQRDLDATIVDPISLDPIRDLSYPPFELSSNHTSEAGVQANVKHYFDGQFLAHYVVSTANFMNPINR